MAKTRTYRPSYTVVSLCLVILSVFGVIVESLRSKIPPNKLNRLQYEKADYLVQGSRSEVDWRPLSPEAFAEARRSGKPIFMLIGVPFSKIARDADRLIFEDREVASFLNRYMICIRVDAQADPRWMSAFLPVRRGAIAGLIGLQMWFLTPEGQLFENAGEIGTTQPIDPDALSAILVRVREKLRRIREGDPEIEAPGSEQASDKTVLTRPSFPAAFSDAKVMDEISREGSSDLGGFIRFGRVRVLPSVLNYLLVTGRHQDLKRMLDALLRSPLVDWLDGGFYRSYEPGPNLRLEFDKIALMDAELMAVFAKSAVVLDEPIYRDVAQKTFDNLAGEFVQSGLIAGCRQGDEQARGRSARNSFSPTKLRELLTPEQREIARRDLGLRTETNPIMSVRARDPSVVLDAQSPARGVLDILRRSRTTSGSYAGERQLDIHGSVTARLLECARLWGDEDRLLKADELFSRLDWFLAGDDVKHTLDPGLPDRPFLGDYLAYADASLQHFLAFGREDSLLKGARVLLRARFLFEESAPGVWKTAIQRADELGPRDVDVPEVLDFVRESCTAQAIRLCSAYGKLSDQDSGQLKQEAQSTAAQYSAISGNLGLEASGLFCSAVRTVDDEHAIVVGPGSAATASELVRRRPTRLAAPVIGAMLPRLRSRGPGIYIVRAGRVVLRTDSVAKAAESLKPSFSWTP